MGTGTVSAKDRKYRLFFEARKFVRSLKLKNEKEWEEYCSKNRPLDIPSHPDYIYKNDWRGMGDWLGTGRIAPQKRAYRPFDEARKFVHTLGFKNVEEWNAYCKSGDKPEDIPSYPTGAAYRKEWKGWGDWLGTGYIAPSKREYRAFEKAREYVHRLELKNQKEWNAYCKSGDKPEDIPQDARRIYTKEWISWGDWLGTNTISSHDRKYHAFEKAKEYVHTLNLKNERDWRKYLNSERRSVDIPSHPDKVYKGSWKGWGDWLGTGTISVWKREYRAFEKAREFARLQNIKSGTEWEQFCKLGNKPSDILYSPEQVYKDEWISWGDWLGTGTISNQIKGWSIEKIKVLLRSLIESRIIYDWDEAVLYSFLSRKGVLDLDGRHRQFFKSLIEASKTKEGLRAIEDYANSDSEIIPDLSKLARLHDESKEELEIASSQELTKLVSNEDPLDYGQIKTAEQILANTNVLESINVDGEAMEFYLDYSIDELWKSAFRYGEEKLLEL